VAQRIEQFDAPEDVFQAIVGNAVRLNGNGSNAEDILHELNNNEDLASVSFMFLYLSCCCTFNIFRLVHTDDSNKAPVHFCYCI
jgi:hypothetical protein